MPSGWVLSTLLAPLTAVCLLPRAFGLHPPFRSSPRKGLGTLPGEGTSLARGQQLLMPELGRESLASCCPEGPGTLGVPQTFPFRSAGGLGTRAERWAPGHPLCALCERSARFGRGRGVHIRGRTGPSGVPSLQFPIISCNEAENRINNSSETI